MSRDDVRTRHRERYLEDYEPRRPRKKKRKKKKSIMTPILLLLVLILVTIVGLFSYKEYQEYKEAQKIKVKTVDLSDKATAMALSWLADIDDNGLDYRKVRDCIGELKLSVTLTPAGKKKTYMQSIEESNYADCQEKAYEGLKKAYVKAVETRLINEGFEGEVTESFVDELMQEAYGLSLDEYLKSMDIQLLPTWEELSTQYSGEVNDEY